MTTKYFLNFFMLILILSLITCKKEDEDKYELTVTKPPRKIVYYEGDTLDLNGLEVSIMKNNEDPKIIPFSNFSTEGFTTYPANGFKLTSDIKEVKIMHTPSKEYISQNLQVDKILITLKGVEKISDTPFSNPSNCIIYNGKLFVTTRTGIYSFDFSSKSWSLINANARINYNGDSGAGVSSIVNGKWQIFANLYNAGSINLFTYDFNQNILSTKILEQNYSHEVKALFHNDSLFVYDFSDYSIHKQKMYVYDFNKETYVKLSDNNGVSPRFFNLYYLNDAKIGNDYYALIGESNPNVYKFNKAKKVLEFVKNIKHRTYFKECFNGINFKYGDFIIYGLGGVFGGVAGSDEYSTVGVNKTFAYYNPLTGESGEVYNKFYEKRIGVLSFEFENDIYFIGGIGMPAQNIITDNDLINRTCIEKLIFEKTAR
ncbi:MAG: hypothetical protein EHM93_18900 [Bacteroidales bacterium]|nr:MAG: hypothetical protein EHM93_18900 [Bacteroidales bacterium]